MKTKNKWFWAFLIAVVALAVAVTVAIVIGIGSKPDTTDDTPPAATPPADGPETGVYYYDVAGGEVLLSLNSGNKFTIAGPQINKSGDYTVSGNVITFDFVRDEDGTAQAEYTGDTVKLTYNDSVLNFIKKVYYKVVFNTNDGSPVAEVTVLNGKSVAKPADTTKDGNVFLGWYADEALTTVFDFETSVITADTTVYAKWAPVAVGQNEYNATLDPNYEGAEILDVLRTIGGKLYDVPSPKREGYTFCGWYISAYEDGDKLTYAYTADTVFNANTTLYAVWAEDNSDKLSTPAANILTDSVQWDAVSGASRYQIKITDLNGNVLMEEETGSTMQAVDFNSYPAGDYIITVTALSSNADSNSVAAVRYFKNKALDRVSSCQVVNGVVIFGAVKNAEKYLITVDCGNAAHKHTAFDNGTSTNFSIANCSMQKGGIKITVTAQAKGFADSVSETFVYDRSLASVSAIEYNKDTDTFVWNAVDFAASYKVTVTVGGQTYVFDNGNRTSFSVASYTGDIEVSVVPVTEGYNSPDAVSATCQKVVPAAPSDLAVIGGQLTWTAVDGATSYEVKVGDSTHTVNVNSVDLSALNLTAGATYKVSVKTLKDNDSSAYCEAIEIAYLAAPELTYMNNTVYWTPVVGANNYEVRVNGIGAFAVSGEYSAKIKLEKAGINTVEVRYTDNGGCDWVLIEVRAFEVVYKSRSLMVGDKYEYVAIGDALLMPSDLENVGYDFNGWYTTPSAAAGNGIRYEDDAVFTGNTDLVLYADWTPKTYQIIFDNESYDITNMPADAKSDVVYGESYVLTVPVSSNKIYETFLGWYTGPGGSGIQLTDEDGNCIVPYGYADNTIAYPHFNSGVLSYELQADGTYAVFAGPNFDQVTNVVIPQTYDGIPVTVILENAFYNHKKVVTISIPDSIELVGINAFSNTDSLAEINVYEVPGNHRKYYSSHDGALIRDDMGTIFLEAFPRAKTDSFTIPEGVQVLRNKVFQYAKVSEIVIASTVTSIQTKAFYRCENLKRIEFAGGRTSEVAFDSTMFFLTENIEEIKLPAKIKEINIDLFKSFEKLTTIEVEDGGSRYGSVDGMLTNAIKDTIVYAPTAIKGEYRVPGSINYIADGAFSDHKGITSVVIPAHVLGIGNNAFSDCVHITMVTFEGGRLDDLTVGTNAFARCNQLRSVNFGKKGATETDIGAITIGDSAFAPNDAAVKNLTAVIFGDGTNIKSIGNNAFKDQTNLYNISYGDNVVVAAIGNYAFSGNTSLKTILIHSSTTSVGAGAFAGCTDAANVVFAEGGTEVSFGEGVFASCTKLVKVQLPSTVTSLQNSAFAGCDALSEITVDANNKVLAAIDNVLYGIDSNGKPVTLLFYPKTMAADSAALAMLPWSTITAIGDYAFAENPKITSFVIPATLTSIGNNAFAGCTNLASVTFAEGGSAALTVGNNAFASCSKAEEIKLPARTVSIGASAFEGCAFESFEMPANVTTVGNKAFASNTKLTAIVITDKIRYIGQGAFKGCSKLATVTFVESDTQIEMGGASDAGVFQSCTVLTGIDFNGRVTKLGAYAFKSSGLKTIDLTGVTEIGASAFASTKLTTVTIPTSVVSIGNSAFASVSTLTSVTFAPGGTDALVLGSSMFSSTKLTEITFPARVTSLYSNISANSKNDFMVPDIADMFASVTTLKNIFVEEGCANYKSIDGVLYELDENGNPVTLLFCPVMNQGVTVGGKKTVVVPCTVTLVANRAFADVRAIQVVTFESYAEDHENYNKQLLHIGAGVYNVYTISNTKNYTVFGSTTSSIYNSNTLEQVNFPAHLAKVGVYAFGKAKTTAFKVTFNLDAKNVEFGTNAFSQLGSKLTDELNLPAISKLGTSAFSGLSKITKLTFAPGSTLTNITGSSFSSCGASEIVIPASVVTIDSSSLTSAKFTKISFESGSQLTTIGFMAFGMNSKLTTIDFTNATKLTTIEGRAFEQCSALTSITIPDSVMSIGGSAFGSCSKLTTVVLPANYPASALFGYDPTQYSDQSIFNGASKLSEIRINNDSQTGAQLRTVDGVLYDRNLTIVYAYPAAKDPATYTIPDTVKTIEFQAFKGYKGETIALHEGLITIMDGAFTSCTSMTNIVIPATVKTIGEGAFQSCSKLETVIFAEGSQLEAIGAKAFYSLKKLDTITLPDSVKSIGDQAFYQSSLSQIILPAALETLGAQAFSGCERLFKVVVQEKLKTIGDKAFEKTAIQTINIPASVTSIGTGAFINAADLTTVTFGTGTHLTVIADSTFEGCVALKNINLPEGLTDIGSKAFAGATSLEALNIPNTVTAFTESVFDGATSLKEINIPAQLTTIGARAFANTAITSFTFSAKVTEIGASAFEGCEALTSVVFEKDNMMTALGTDAAAQDSIFKGTIALETVVLPDKLELIGGHVFENSGITSLVLPSSVNTIGSYAFANCDGITEVTISGNVLHIGAFAFFDCDNLTKAEMSFGLEYLGSLAFGACEKLTTAQIPASVISVGANPYAGCITSGTIELDPDNQIFIYEDGMLFDYSKSTLYYYSPANTAETVVLPDTVTEIVAGAFAGAQMKTIVIPAKFGTIPAYAFYGCTKLENVTIESGITSIGAHAFDGCTSLDNVTLPNTALSIGDYAFANASSLSSFTFEDTTSAAPYVLGTHIFENCVSITEVIMPNFHNVTDTEASRYGVQSSAAKRQGMIPSYMFAGTGIVNAVLPADVTFLSADGVFMNCKSLESFSFEGIIDCTYIGSYFFYGCSKIEEILLPHGATDPLNNKNGGYTFAYCTSLKKITIGYSSMGSTYYGAEHMFEGCTSLTEFVWQKFKKSGSGANTTYTYTAEYLPYVGPYYFAGCTSLESFTVGMNNTSYFKGATIDAYAFYGCTALKEFTFANIYNLNPPLLKKLGDYAFAGCTALTNITIDAKVGYYEDYRFVILGEHVFEGWTAGQSIKFTRNTAEELQYMVEKGTFDGCQATVKDQDDQTVNENN